MNQYYRNRILGILLLTLFSFSCTSNLDFNQVNNIKLEPIFSANLTYFDIPAKEFIVNGTENSVIFDDKNFDVFRDSFFRKSLRKVDLFFKVNNTIARSYTIDIQFLDGNNQPLYTIHFDVPAYAGTDNEFSQIENFEGAKLDLLKRAKKMKFTIKMGSGPALNQSSPGSLKLQSSATAYLVVE
jgi:hypothetical protein